MRAVRHWSDPALPPYEITSVVRSAGLAPVTARCGAVPCYVLGPSTRSARRCGCVVDARSAISCTCGAALGYDRNRSRSRDLSGAGYEPPGSRIVRRRPTWGGSKAAVMPAARRGRRHRVWHAPARGASVAAPTARAAAEPPRPFQCPHRAAPARPANAPAPRRDRPAGEPAPRRGAVAEPALPPRAAVAAPAAQAGDERNARRPPALPPADSSHPSAAPRRRRRRDGAERGRVRQSQTSDARRMKSAPENPGALPRSNGRAEPRRSALGGLGFDHLGLPSPCRCRSESGAASWPRESRARGRRAGDRSRASALDLDVVGELEHALERARRDALIEHLALLLVGLGLLVAADRQRVLLGHDRQLGLGEAGDRDA